MAAHNFASNRLVDVENMSEEELKVIQKYYSRLKYETKKDETLQESHSIDEAGKMYQMKKDREKIITDDIEVRKNQKK